jgi:hypothetical protein
VLEAPRPFSPPCERDNEVGFQAANEGPVAAVVSDPARLGEPERVFRSKIWPQAVAWLCVLVCFGISAIALSMFRLPPSPKRKPATLYAVAGLFGLGGAVAGYVGLRLKGQKYLVFKDHLVAYTGTQCIILRWDQIREIYRIVHPAWQQFRIHSYKGSLLLTGDTKEHIMLGELVSRRVAERLLPDAWRQIEAGRKVSFGPIRISRAGLDCHDDPIPWHQIQGFTFGLNPYAVRGSMVSNMIHLRITPASQVEMGEIPNYALFEELARRLHPSCVA